MPRRRFSLLVITIYVALALFYVVRPVRLTAPVSSADLSAFTRELQARIPPLLESSHTPGASVALIQHGQVIWVGTFGLANVEQHVPVTPQTIFQAASISKTVAAWGVMRLVERGGLQLDAPAERYLTRWHIPASSFDRNGVTIRRLLSHTSGLADIEYMGYPPGAPLPSLEESLTVGPPAPTGMMKNSPGSMGVGGTRILTQPGTAYVYSDANYVLLQLVIEEVTGMPFAAYMQEQVLAPLGMMDSSFARPPGMIARTTVPYDVYARQLPDFRMVELAPAGLYTTTSDLGRFVAAGLPGPDGEPVGRGVIAPASLEQMTSPAIAIQGFEGWIYADAYGLGYFIETLPGGEQLISHMGGNPGWMCEFAAIPSTGDGVVIMTNSSSGQEVFADVLTSWTTWLHQGEVHVANAINVARRMFQALSFSLFAAAAILLAGLLVGVRRGRRWSRLADPTFRRILGSTLCVAALVLYWTVLRPLVEINMPGEASGMLWAVNSLGLVILLNALLFEKC